MLYSSLEELEQLGKMIADMLFLAQADNAVSKPELSNIDPVDEVRALLEYFEALAEDTGVALRLEGNAPAVRGDRLMLRRALGNLISNALRYTARGQTLAHRRADREAAGALELPAPLLGEREVKLAEGLVAELALAVSFEVLRDRASFAFEGGDVAFGFPLPSGRAPDTSAWLVARTAPARWRMNVRPMSLRTGMPRSSSA